MERFEVEFQIGATKLGWAFKARDKTSGYLVRFVHIPPIPSLPPSPTPPRALSPLIADPSRC